ncbi:MAG: hypothetical protein HZA22_14005 [Nitrospirae bacterium]|nr:hypothetical protein [Nitrospirota bacterium]MBI5696072.1 hypothetical protein [Nitrospirota bacterium]
MLEVTGSAVAEFKKVLEDEQNKGLSIKIKARMGQSSCCSCGPTPEYEMGLVEKGDAGDVMQDFDGVKFYLDPESSEFLGTSEIDFSEEMGFIVKDMSESSGGCGCGGGDYGEHGHGHGGGSCCG